MSEEEGKAPSGSAFRNWGLKAGQDLNGWKGRRKQGMQKKEKKRKTEHRQHEA